MKKIRIIILSLFMILSMTTGIAANTIGNYSVVNNPSQIKLISYPEGTNVTFGVKGEGYSSYYYVRGLSGIVQSTNIKVNINGQEQWFDKDDSGDFVAPKNYLDMYVPKGTYQPTVKYEDYETLLLNEFEIGINKENKIVPNFNSNTKEMELDFSNFEESEREELINLFLDPSYKPDVARTLAINAVNIDNNIIRNGYGPFYRDGNILKVKSWAIDMVKESEDRKNYNGGFVSIEGYTNVPLGNFTFESVVSNVQLSAKIFQEKDYVFLDIDCGNQDNLNKILLLRNIGVTFTQQFGVGVDYLTITDLKNMGAVTYPGNNVIRIQLNTEGGINGFTGYQVVFEGMYGIDVGCNAAFVIAPVPSAVRSDMTTLSEVQLTRGWPRYSNKDPYSNGDVWHWVDSNQTLKTGSYKARIEVWDYEGSEYLSESSKKQGVYVDYETICKDVDNVEYIVENGHHYLEATIQIVKPEKVDGYNANIVNFDPNNKDDSYANNNKTSVSKIDTVISDSSKTAVEYYDITIDDGNVTSINDAGEFTVVVPGWVDDVQLQDGKERKYSVVTYHDGETRTIPATDNGDGTITFASDKFSTFAVAFKDLKFTGKLENTTEKENNSCNAELSLSSDAIANKILTDDDLNKLASGEDVKVYLKVNDISSTVSTTDKNLIDSAKGSSNVSMYFDIKLQKKIGTSSPTNVTETNGKVKISLQIPRELINSNSDVTRHYYVIRVHGTDVTVLDCAKVDSQTISFETDKFSTYALAYKDIVNSSSGSSSGSSTTTLKPVVNTSAK